MLKAYFDDSGTHAEADVCVCGGYMGSTRNWESFGRRWLRAGGGPNFHAKEFFGKHDAAERAKPLWAAINETDIWPIVAAIDLKAFAEFSESERRYLTGGYWNGRKLTWANPSGSPNRPFYLPYQIAIGVALERTRPGRKVDFTLDRQDVLYGYMRDLYRRWKDSAPSESGRRTRQLIERMGDITEGDRPHHPGLQAADMLSYCTYHYMRYEFHKTSVPLQVAACRSAIVVKTQEDGRRIDRELMSKWLLEELPQSVRDGSADTRRQSKA